MNQMDSPFQIAGKEFTDGLFKSIRSNLKSRDDEVQNITKQIVDNIFSAIGKSLKDNFKLSEAGKIFGEQSSEFFKAMGLKKVSSEFVNELNDGMKSAAEALNLKTPGEKVGKELGAGLKEMGEPITDAFGKITADLSRNVTLSSLPYIASSALISAGVPLAAYYCYYRLKHNIGRPKLALEIKNVGYLDRIQEEITRLGSHTFEILYSGAKWSLISGALSLACYLPAIISYELMTRPDFLQMQNFQKDCQFLIGRVTLGSGALAGAYTLASKIKNWASEKFFSPPPPKPIFHKQLMQKIEELSESTRNLKKNGGFFQNILLYGPGGTGKTMVAKEIAKRLGMNYIMMSGGDLAQYIHRSEHVTELNKLFEKIQNSRNPTILFIDEMESLCRDRKTMDRSQLLELLNAFLSHTGKESSQFMIIGATNLPDLIDKAVLSRMDHKLEIQPPDLEIRMQILQQYLERFFTKKEKQEFFPTKLIRLLSKLKF